MSKKYPVQLTEAQRLTLRELVSRGTAPARTLARAHILLKVDEGEGGPAWPHARVLESARLPRNECHKQLWSASRRRAAELASQFACTQHIMGAVAMTVTGYCIIG